MNFRWQIYGKFAFESSNREGRYRYRLHTGDNIFARFELNFRECKIQMLLFVMVQMLCRSREKRRKNTKMNSGASRNSIKLANRELFVS